jgi:hypothetical protein
VFALAVVLVAPAGATAALRNPHLQSSCASGFAYGEVVLKNWRVEGCHKTGNEQGSETSREVFKGKVELNGMIVEGSSDLLLTQKSVSRGGRPSLQAHVSRGGSSTKLVLDPKIGTERRRIVLASGSFDFAGGISSLAQDPGLVQAEREGAVPIALAASTPTTNSSATIDLPVTGIPALLGMRLRDEIHGVDVHSGTGAADKGGMEFRVNLSLGEDAPGLLKDWVARVKIETVDGTGMKITGLVFKVPDIAIEGIGGFKDMELTYSESQDEWSGGVFLDLGTLFPSLDFDMSVRASDGVPTSIAAAVDNLNIPVGQTGIVLQSVRAAFDMDPLGFAAGLGATAGPMVAGAAVVRIDGDLAVALEPSFRLDARGRARMLPAGDGQIASGNMHIVLDSAGYLEIGGGADYQVKLLGVGVGAEIDGNGRYATDRNRFNISASATGKLFLGFIGDFDVVRYAAVVSSDGWGACGNVLPFVQAGVGMNWDHGPELIFGCDLSEFNAPVSGQIAQAGNSRSFTLEAGVKTLAVEITANAPEPKVKLTGPGGQSVFTTPATGIRMYGADAAVIAQPGQAMQLAAVRNPAAGRYTLSWPADGPQVTNVRIARDVLPVEAQAAVEKLSGKPGRRRLRLRAIRNLLAGEKIELGLRNAQGIIPVGVPGSADASFDFDDVPPGAYQVVASVVRNGIPLPARTRVLGTYVAKAPPGPLRVAAVANRKNVVTALARVRKGAEAPDAWLYVLRTRKHPFLVKRGKVGKPVTFRVPAGVGGLSVAVAPMLKGRVLKARAVVATVKTPKGR